MVQFQTQIWKIPTKGDTFELRSIKNTNSDNMIWQFIKIVLGTGKMQPCIWSTTHIWSQYSLCLHRWKLCYGWLDVWRPGQASAAGWWWCEGGGGVKVVVVWWWCGGSVVVGTVWHSWDVSNSAVHSALHQKLEYQRSVVTRYGIQTWDNRHGTTDTGHQTMRQRTTDRETQDNRRMGT